MVYVAWKDLTPFFSYLLTCYRYIELNPVRAMDDINHPSEYPWSSYRFNALGADNSLLVPHPEYLRLGKTKTGRQQAYRELFKAQIPQLTLNEIRQATNKAWVLGDDRFKEMIELKLARAAAPKTRGGDRKSKAYRESSIINRV